jgi:hypothetical protein
VAARSDAFRRRRRRIGGRLGLWGGLLGGLLAGGLLLAWGLREPPPAPAELRAAPPAAPPASSPVVLSMPREAPRSAAAGPAPRRAAVSAAPVAVVAPPIAADPEPPLCAAPQQAASRWLAALQDSGDDATRAAGLLVALDDPAAPAELRTRLVTLAAGSHDVRVIAWAQRACAGSDAPACAALAPERWAEAEPDNAAAWLALAADARLDDAGRDAALHRAAEAPRLDSHMPALHRLAAAAEPAALEAAANAAEVRAALHRRVAAARADWRVTEALRRLCHAGLPADGGARGDCERLAERLATQGQSLPDLVQAVELARLFDADEARRTAWRDDAAALEALQAARFGDAPGAGCVPPEGFADYVTDVGRVGEVAALRALRANAAPR